MFYYLLKINFVLLYYLIHHKNLVYLNKFDSNKYYKLESYNIHIFYVQKSDNSLNKIIDKLKINKYELNNNIAIRRNKCYYIFLYNIYNIKILYKFLDNSNTFTTSDKKYIKKSLQSIVNYITWLLTYDEIVKSNFYKNNKVTLSFKNKTAILKLVCTPDKYIKNRICKYLPSNSKYKITEFKIHLNSRGVICRIFLNAPHPNCNEYYEWCLPESVKNKKLIDALNDIILTSKVYNFDDCYDSSYYFKLVNKNSIIDW